MQLWSLCIDLLVIDRFASIRTRENSNTPWYQCKLWQCMPLLLRINLVLFDLWKRMKQAIFWTCFCVHYLLICLPCLSTDVIASLDAHQDSPVIKNGSNTYHETFIAGMVHLEVIIQKPRDLDLDGIKFDWNFGDGSQLNHSQLQNVTHNFTTVKSCTINVYIYGWSLGRNYSGTASKTLKFTGILWYTSYDFQLYYYCQFFLWNNSL